jgi:ATP/maltotriose-dependent transcriptional regulator MalT
VLRDDDALIGRQRERAELDQALAAASQGKGGILLLAGEAGVGKTRLVDECLARSNLLSLKGGANELASPPYGPIVAALRSYLRQRPGGLASCGPLTHYLAALLPELGSPAGEVDRATLVEAIGCAFTAVARDEPAVLFLDDLQWADNATLELLPALAATLASQPLLIVGVYRGDEIPRAHPVRRLRSDLRRARQLQELAIAPLDPEATAALAARILGANPTPALAAALYERTEGLPLFLEELAGALAASGRLRPGSDGLELLPGADMPIPDTLRDTMLLRLDGLPDSALKLLEIAAVAGLEFDLELVVGLLGAEDGLDELFERHLIVEGEPGRAAFRHALTREAIYGDISWARRRSLHRQIAAHLEAQGAYPQTIAEHWLAAKETERARAALLAAVRHSCEVHAYRDAANLAHRALELWPEAVDETGRLDMLDQLGHCAQLSGMLAEAARAWRDVAEGRRANGELRAYAEVTRKLANVAELRGHWERALAARADAAQVFATSGQPAEAAAERLAAAAHLRSAAHFRASLELLATALAEAEQAQRWDLKARIIGLQGNIYARMGQTAAGLALVREGLALALEHNHPGPAAEVYQRLADALEHTGDYAEAKATYSTAFHFCQANDVPATAQLCMACLAVVLYQTGEWDRAATICRDVLAAPASTAHARAAAGASLGLVSAMRGQPSRARPLLLEAASLARHIELAAAEILATWGLALVDAQNGDDEAVTAHYRFILSRWSGLEDRHYAVPPLRWAVDWFCDIRADADARACASALATIAADIGQPEALAALAHSLGMVALLDGDPKQAIQQFDHALGLLRDVDVPIYHAATYLRAGMARAAADQRKTAIDQLTQAYRIARKLGARDMTMRVARTLQELGEPVERRLGAGAADRFGHGNLTRRQLEILRLVALGQTNSEIARELFLSPRTVEMHVGNILANLDSRSRAEAVHRAAELGLLDE